ncbi:hypothetical protein ABZ477_02590 [Microbacterium sp. NPDC019599]|uniref:hypothetical protein n=1 Tax=Microbacterium sp. NPDC019599 TaxID=3154690 RepID=UPI003405CF49
MSTVNSHTAGIAAGGDGVGADLAAEAHASLVRRIEDANQSVVDELVTAQQQWTAQLAELGRAPAVIACAQRYEELVRAAAAAAQDPAAGEQLRTATEAYTDSLRAANAAVATAVSDAQGAYLAALGTVAQSSDAANVEIADAVDDYYKDLASVLQQELGVRQELRREAHRTASSAPKARVQRTVADDSLLWPGAGEGADASVGEPAPRSDVKAPPRTAKKPPSGRAGTGRQPARKPGR